MNQVVKTSQPTVAGWLETQGSSLLSGALDVWKQVESIKAIKANSGAEHVQAQVEPELTNGAAVAIDKTPEQPKTMGFEVNQPLLIASLGVLAIAFLLKGKRK